jgi:hypothetical protein
VINAGAVVVRYGSSVGRASQIIKSPPVVCVSLRSPAAEKWRILMLLFRVPEVKIQQTGALPDVAVVTQRVAHQGQLDSVNCGGAQGQDVVVTMCSGRVFT